MPVIDPGVRKNLEKVKRIIGVYSGKGGVGKTTISVNIAAFLVNKGYRVGLLDADIDCPNITRALGVKGELDVDPLDERIIPHEKQGIKVVSMASLQKEEDEAIIWRGPMLTDTLMKFLGKTVWGSLDYLIIDLPPGTSDVPLTIMKYVQPHGIVLVTTPRSIAEVDARKSANLAKMTNVKVLGVVENMSGPPFGSGKGEECASVIGTSLLGKIPFDDSFMTSVDEGVPAVSTFKNAFQSIAEIVKKMQDVEEKLLGEKLAEPKKGVLHSTKNIAQDFKDQMMDRYKTLKD